jgi:hypothetical protein
LHQLVAFFHACTRLEQGFRDHAADLRGDVDAFDAVSVPMPAISGCQFSDLASSAETVCTGAGALWMLWAMNAGKA